MSSHRNDMDKLFAKWNQPNSPGVSVAVISAGETIFRQSYGCASLEYEIPITPETIFDCGSIAKQFTAFAMAMLIGNKPPMGELTLDDDIRINLPEVPDFGAKITIRNLIHHTSGLHSPTPILRWTQEGYSTQDVVRMVRYQKRLAFCPGDAFEYSNTGYALLSKIVEQVTQQPFADWMKVNVFDPLEMMNTFFNQDYTQIIRNVAHTYAPVQNNRYKIDTQSYPVGSSALFSNVVDLEKWIVNFETGQVGGFHVLEQMQEQGVLNNRYRTNYAFGLYIGEWDGIKLIEHGGEGRGFRSALSYSFNKKVGVVILSNSSDCDVWGLVRRIYDLVIDHQPKYSHAQTQKTDDQNDDLDPSIYDAYIGKYLIEPGHILTIMKENQRLYWQITGQPKFELIPKSETNFLDKDGDPVVFERDINGKCDRVSLIWSHGQATTAKRLSPGLLSNLSDFTGMYYCEEIETVFHLEIIKNQLYAKNLEQGEILLEPCDQDQFAADPWWFRQIDFKRNDRNNVTEFYLTVCQGKSHLEFKKTIA